MLVHERPHNCWPSFDARLSAFAFLQGDDELRAVAVCDVEDARLPGVQRGHRGLAGERSALGRPKPAGGL